MGATEGRFDRATRLCGDARRCDTGAGGGRELSRLARSDDLAGGAAGAGRRRRQLRRPSSEPNSTFECTFDSKKFKPCSSPSKYKHLDFGKHRFAVRATDAAGNTDSSPDKDRFKRKD
jgi:hypothetical protein